MIDKEQCLPGVRVIVNEKKTKWNEFLNIIHNGLICFPFSEQGTLPGNEIELIPGTEIEIISKPKRFNDNGNQVKFKIINNDNILSTWWVSFKHKVNII